MSAEAAGLLRLFRYRWVIHVLAELHRERGCRFVLLGRRLGIADGVLRQTLDYLIDEGLVERNPGYGHPSRPEYILSPAGEAIGPACLQAARIQEPAIFTKWGAAVTLLVAEGTSRHSEIKKALPGVTPRALSLALRELTDAGILVRTVMDETPPAVYYAALPKALSIARHLRQLLS